MANQQVAANLAEDWLIGQIESNTNLVNSYQDGEDIAYIYDQALAAIALMSMGKINLAVDILDALENLQLKAPDLNEDGFWSAAKASNGNYVEFSNVVGPTLWVTLAVATYLEATGDNSYNQMAQDALDYTLQFQQADGGINLGSGATAASTEHNLNGQQFSF